MVRIFIVCVLTLFSPCLAYAQGVLGVHDVLEQAEKTVGNIPQKALKTPQSELQDVILFIKEVEEGKFKKPRPQDVPYLRFFSTYAAPQELQREMVLSLSFVIHSLVGPGGLNTGAYYPLAKMEGEEFVPYQKVTDTVWWIDLRDYNWTAEAWEKISLQDGYFVEPILNTFDNSYLRLVAGNAIVRADWFIRHATDNMAQVDRDRDVIYEILLYANVDIPKKEDELYKLFGIDPEKDVKFGNQYLTLVTNSNAVARHKQRILQYSRATTGYVYETYDIKNMEGLRNYKESIFLQKKIGGPPEVFDAGEIILTNVLQMQIYALVDAQGNIIEFADPAVARHINDIIGDVRVKTAISCIDCHSLGIIPSTNILKEFLAEEGEIKLKRKEDKFNFKRAYLSNGFEDGVEDSQAIFARALLKVNGLTPQQNGQAFTKIISWYEKDIDLKQAAIDCGVSEELFKEKVEKGTIGNSLKILVRTGEPIPREFWESPGKDGIPGGFQQAMILIHGLTQVTEAIKEVPPVYEVIRETAVMDGDKRIGVLKVGENITTDKEENQNGWIRVVYNNKIAYVRTENIKVKQ